MYKLKYHSSFKDINENNIKIEIYKNTTATVQAEELILSADAVSIQYESDNIFQPLKQSAASINILTSKVLDDLYTGKLNDIQIRVYKNNNLFWLGYQTPNLYSSSYNDIYDELTLECIDTIAQLDNIQFEYITGKNKITSFIDILYFILDKTDADKLINNIYVHTSLSVDNSTNILNRLSIQERNFFDEENESEKCKEVLEDIFSYLGMTLIQYQNSYYIIDYEAIKKGNNQFILYNRKTKASSTVTVNINKRNLMDIGIAEADASISLGDIYNKINIIANTNSINKVIPDAIEDENDIINQNADPNKYYLSTETIDNKNYTLLNAYFKSANNYSYLKPTSMDSSFVFTELDEVTNSNINSITKGTLWQKVADYETKEEPSSLDWKTYISFLQSYGSLWSFEYEYLSLKENPMNIYKGGYLIIDIKYFMSGNYKANSCFKTSDEQYSNTKYGAGFNDTMIPCRLSIGNYYYDGEKWISYDEYNLKVERGYYKTITSNGHVAGAKWYRYKDNYGYWRWVSKNQYDSLSGVEKVSGNCVQNDMHWFNENNTDIFVETWYYNECLLRDRFYLVHINKEGDKVFDTEKSLTNTVSWRFNLADSEDGVAIKMPDNVLFGGLTFQLFTPNHLGVFPMYRTDGGCHVCTAFHISDLKLKYTTSDSVKNIFENETYDPDVLYTNVIDDNYVTELDDIKLKINTYYNKASSYSYVINNNNFIEKILNTTTNKKQKAEEHLIEKYVTHYSSPKFQYENSLINKDISPFSIIHEETLNKDMIVNSVIYNLSNNSANVSLIEI